MDSVNIVIYAEEKISIFALVVNVGVSYEVMDILWHLEDEIPDWAFVWLHFNKVLFSSFALEYPLGVYNSFFPPP